MSETNDTVTISKSDFEALMGRVSNLEKPETVATVQTCNVCGDKVEGRCVKHPNDLTNTVAKDRFGKSVLVNQS